MQSYLVIIPIFVEYILFHIDSNDLISIFEFGRCNLEKNVTGWISI